MSKEEAKGKHNSSDDEAAEDYCDPYIKAIQAVPYFHKSVIINSDFYDNYTHLLRCAIDGCTNSSYIVLQCKKVVRNCSKVYCLPHYLMPCVDDC